MIQNNQELEATLTRIRYFQKQIKKIREVETNPQNYRLSVAGFLTEIDRMNLEVREYLSVHPSELVEQVVEGDCVVIMPEKSTTPENWAKLLQVMKSVHEQNRGISEEEVYQDVQRAVAELRQEDYDKQQKTTHRT